MMAERPHSGEVSETSPKGPKLRDFHSCATGTEVKRSLIPYLISLFGLAILLFSFLKFSFGRALLFTSTWL
jgi:hypothetical protein